MKAIILITSLLFQLNIALSQCTSTQGVELSENINYFKCQNGYKAPLGFEWMKPTKIYIVPYELGSNAQPLHKPNYMVHMENFYRGDNLQEALSIYGYLQKKYNNLDMDFTNPDMQSEVICLDCGLGYFATVSLADGYTMQNIETGRTTNYPNVGFGYTCGQPTIEQAIKVAYKVAKEKLKSPAITFSFNVGVNTGIKTNGSLDNILYSTFGDIDASQYFDYSQRGSGYPIIPESPEDFLEYILSLNKLADQIGDEYGIRRNDDLNYSRRWKQNAKGHEEITKNEYPIFTVKIDGSSKQSDNVQKAQVVKKVEEKSVLENNDKIGNVQKTEAVKQKNVIAANHKKPSLLQTKSNKKENYEFSQNKINESKEKNESNQKIIKELDSALIEYNKGSKQGYENAKKIYLNYVDELNGDQFNKLGFSYWKGDEFELALFYFKKSSVLGDEWGTFNTAFNYYYGKGTIINKKKAFEYLIKIKNSELSKKEEEYFHMLGHCYEEMENDEGKPDYIQAMINFEKGANLGSTDCMLHLGDYSNNSGKITKNIGKAKDWYKKACDLSVQKACDNLKTIE